MSRNKTENLIDILFTKHSRTNKHKNQTIDKRNVEKNDPDNHKKHPKWNP